MTMRKVIKMQELIVNKCKNGKTIIALMENKLLVEEYENDGKIKKLQGNIYCGIVRKVLPGMQSAFVDINERKNAFIHINDIVPKISNETGNREQNFENYKITDYIKEGMPILVQIKKDKENQKGARTSTHINLTGRYAVLMPDVDFITISQKIENQEERNRLKQMANEIIKSINTDGKKFGLIVRTVSENIKKEELEKNVLELVKKWENIKRKFDNKKIERKPIILSSENTDDLSKTIISVIKNNAEFKITVNDEEIYNKIQELLKNVSNKNVKLILKTEDLMNMYDLQQQIDKMLERKIWLKCGGFITIDKTEALTAIDINSGKYVGKKNSSREETLYEINKEATIEIVKQIRLRNISGIIIIDYIDMNSENKNKIINLFQRESKKGRSKIQVVGFTKLDLLEITRKRI